MFNFLTHTDEIRQEMLNEIGLKSLEDLFENIDSSIKIKNVLPGIPEGVSEVEAQKKLNNLAQKNYNANNSITFLGGGVYNRYTPACISNIVQRSEFLTSYTPYQPEISQGTLQAIYEYQSFICNLTGMDVSNASVYDGATASAEAINMACRITNKSKALVASNLNPDYIKVINTYCCNTEIEFLSLDNFKLSINELANKLKANDDYACVLVQVPNYLGTIDDVVEIGELCAKSKAKLIVCVDPISLSILKSPVEYRADIVVGDVQPLGISMAFGGPHGGFIACKTAYVRQLPGRIVGMTQDRDGERAFTLTLQAREQHIRRAKATSNICSNQALVALAATVYLSLVGPQGLKEVANISCQRAHYLASKISKIKGFTILYTDFLYEFAVKADEKLEIKMLLDELKEQGILGGISLNDKINDMKNCLLICTTEMNEIDGINKFVDVLKSISAKYSL